MKTISFFTIVLLIGSFLFTACTKDDTPLVPSAGQTDAAFIQPATDPPVTNYKKSWIDNFPDANTLISKWYLFGDPQPRWIETACWRNGIFNNNGTMPDGAYAASKAKVGSSGGYVIESDVCIDILSGEGAIISPELGLSRYTDPQTLPGMPEAGISMKLIYYGTGLEGIPSMYWNKTFAVMSVLTSDGTYATSGAYAFPVTIASGSWHNLKISVTDTHEVIFYLDNVRIWKPLQLVHNSLLKNKHVLIGYLSPVQEGRAYHDFVRFTYPLAQ